jgi:hypothetical protein
MELALSESSRTSAMTAAEFFDHVGRESPETHLPPMVDDVYMTPAEYRALTMWARTARRMNAALQQIADEKNWDKAVKSAYVAIESEIRAGSADELSPEGFSDHVLNRATARIQAAAGPITHYLPCYLINGGGLQDLQIGPVEFIHGAQLVNRIVAESGRQPEWLDAYKALTEQPATAESSRTVRDPSTKNIWPAKDVWQMSKMPWIAVVRVKGYEPLMARRRANDAARLAVAAFGLSLHPNSSRDMGLVSEWARQPVTKSLFQVPGQDILVSIQNNPPQVFVENDFSEFLGRQRDYLNWVGDAIHDAMSDSPSPRRLRDCWLNALYWYYIGCSEPSDARATICLSSAFESLATSVGAQSILDLIETILGTRRTNIIAPSLGWTLEQAVSEIYNAARSEIVHGGRFVIFREYQDARAVAAELCRYMLLKAQSYLREYEVATGRKAEADRKDTFLKWISMKRAKP